MWCGRTDVKMCREWGEVDVFFLMIRRPPRSTQSRSSAASDVYKRQTPETAATIDDPVVRARALHVTGENQRVLRFAAALREGDPDAAGRLMVESHASMRDLYECSTAQVDAVVERICATPGVYGARITGGGYGGCVVALTEPGALLSGWVVRPVDGARLV